MQGYEYIRISIDFGDLSELNSLSSTGWRVVYGNDKYLLLERPLTAEGQEKAIRYYIERGKRRDV